MTLPQFLEKLSKPQITEEVLKLCRLYPEVEIYFEEKISEINSEQKITTTSVSENMSPAISSVTRQSSPQEKINLFKSIFAGRDDVFALRWFNQKTNKSGYSPVCANKWQSGKCDLKKFSCSKCPYKSLVKLDDRFLFNHLAGKNENACDVIGLYPLMNGNVCRFLAFDFDSHKGFENFWRDDVFAVKSICKEFDISSYTEISRSGNGCHLWIFFSENVSAVLARNLGFDILKMAMQKRHSLSFESFDRIFPNQNEIPDGGYGNLIALPLQGKAVKDGKSVFVDDFLKPFCDQWEFLSSIKKVDEAFIKTVLSKIRKTLPEYVQEEKFEIEEENSKSVNKNFKFNDDKSCSEKTQIFSKADFQEKVFIRLTNYVEISKKGISENALLALRRTAVFLNPEYFKKLKMHLPLYNIPRYIDCSKNSGDFLLLPRGVLEKIKALLNSAEVEYEIADEREKGSSIEIKFYGTLFENQKTAFNSLKNADCGILSAGTGFGKTVVSAALIAEKKVSTLILVTSNALLEQWKNRLQDFLQITPGTISGGKDKSTGIVDIAIVKSLCEQNTDELKKRLYKYGMLIVDECHHVAAFQTENLVSSFRAKYVYGLSATPIRRDGHQKIIFYQCGPVLYETTARQMSQMQTFSHYFIPRFTSFHLLEEKNSKNKNLNEYFEKMIKNEARNLMIVSDIKKSVENGRTPLVLSDRLEHLEILKEKLTGCAENVILITGRGTQKQKKQQLEELNSVPSAETLIVLATGKYVGEGFDNPRFDTLMLALPFSWKGLLSQYCGRLHRNFEGKDEVQIFDYVDFLVPVFDRMYQNRLKGYRQMDYSIKPCLPNSDSSSDSNENAQKETEQDSGLKDFETAKKHFIKDISDARSKIVICAPYLSKTEVTDFSFFASKKISEGVKIFILTKKEEDEQKVQKNGTLISILQNKGVQIVFTKTKGQKLAVIDERILWYGSINFLGFTEKDECSMRINDSTLASKIEGEISSNYVATDFIYKPVEAAVD